MLEKMFLKLHGVWGESKNPRHLGEIEISGFDWGGKYQRPASAGVAPGTVLISDVTVYKRSDTTSPILWRAFTSGENFAEGELTIEKLSESGGLINSVIVKFISILVGSVKNENSLAVGGVVESVTLNFETLKVMRP